MRSLRARARARASASPFAERALTAPTSLPRAGLWAGSERQNTNDTSLTSEYVFAMVKGGANGFALKGQDATQGNLTTMYDGVRPNGYQPSKHSRACAAPENPLTRRLSSRPQ